MPSASVNMRFHDNKLYEGPKEQDSVNEHSSLIALDTAVTEEEDVDFWHSQKFGFIVVCISAICYAGSATCVSLAGDLPTPLVIWAKFASVAVYTGIWALVGKIKLMDVQDKQVLILRTIFGILGSASGTYAFQNLPVGEASVLQSAAPVFTAIFSTCLLGDTVSAMTGFLITTCMAGIVMLVDPSAMASDSTVGDVTLIAFMIGLLPAIFKGMVYIFIKKSSKSKMHYIVMSFWFSSFGMFVLTFFIGCTVVIVSFLDQDCDWVIRKLDTTECFYLVAIGIIGFCGQVTMTKATQSINATVASLIRNGDIIFTLFFQVVYFKEIPSFIQVVGIIIMVISIIGVIVVKERARIEAARALQKDDHAKSFDMFQELILSARRRLFKKTSDNEDDPLCREKSVSR